MASLLASNTDLIVSIICLLGVRQEADDYLLRLQETWLPTTGDDPAQ